MPDPDPPQGLPDVRLSALSRWDNEGGAFPAAAREAHPDPPDMRNAELVLLRVRVIALENLLIAVLAKASTGSVRRPVKWLTSSLPEPALPSSLSRSGRYNT